MLGIWVARFLQVFIFALFARLILDYVRMFKPSWTPRGLMLWFAESVYTFTDPPLKFFRKFIPPLRLGGVALDISFIVLFFAVQILQGLALTYL
jgi:YggT family protein